MEIVIKIPDGFEQNFNRDRFEEALASSDPIVVAMLQEAIRNAVVIPKGHGRLFDEINIESIALDDGADYVIHKRNDEVHCEIVARTILEADTDHKVEPSPNCRLCKHYSDRHDKKWHCYCNYGIRSEIPADVVLRCVKRMPDICCFAFEKEKEVKDYVL